VPRVARSTPYLGGSRRRSIVAATVLFKFAKRSNTPLERHKIRDKNAKTWPKQQKISFELFGSFQENTSSGSNFRFAHKQRHQLLTKTRKRQTSFRNETTSRDIDSPGSCSSCCSTAGSTGTGRRTAAPTVRTQTRRCCPRRRSSSCSVCCRQQRVLFSAATTS